jgi:acetyl-CoA C-acetyltransferase
MSLRGQTAIVGYGELQNTRTNPTGKTIMGHLADAAYAALNDAGIRKEEVDGLIAEPPFGRPGLGFAFDLAEYLGIRPNYATALNENAATFIATAAAAIHAGYGDTFLCINGGITGGPFTPGPTDAIDSQFVDPYGPVVAANGWYAQIARRHAYEYGTTDAQRAKVAADQRFNTQGNENSVFNGQPASQEDILNSRLVADPLRLLECVMPCTGAAATIVMSAEKAKALKNPPVYILGAGQHNWRAEHGVDWVRPITTSPATVGARRAFEMAGVGPKDMDMAQIYDCYTITVMITLEDAGFIPKGEAGPWYESTDTTHQGSMPVNTGGGQLSCGQSVAGTTQVVEGTRQLMGRAGVRQVPNNPELCYINT